MKEKTALINNREMFSALQVRDFRIFWVGQVISFSGSWMQSTAQGWLVYFLTKSSVYLGLVATASSLPVLLLTLAGGVVADKFRKRNLLILTQTLSILPAVLAAILIDLKMITPLAIVIFASVLGTVNAFDIPARQSFFVEMVQKGRLMNAIALNSAAFNAARIMGPVMAGLAIATVGVSACFYLNGLSFVAAIAALVKIKAGREARTQKDVPDKKEKGHWTAKSSSFFKELYEGINFVKNTEDVLSIMILVAVFSLFGMPLITLLPVFAEDILKVGAKGLGILGGASGVGSFVAASFIAFKGDIMEKGRFMFIAAMVFSISILSFSISTNYHASLMILVFTGWGIVSFLAVGNSFIQIATPDMLRGRVMSVYTMVFFGMAPIGNSVMGLIADAVGADRAVSIGAVICVSAGLLLAKRLISITQKAPNKA